MTIVSTPFGLWGAGVFVAVLACVVYCVETVIVFKRREKYDGQ